MKKIILFLTLICFLFCFSVIIFAQNLKSEEDYFQEIGQFLETGKIDAAIQTNKNMIADYPNSVNAYLSIALIYADQKKFDDAVINAQKAFSFPLIPLTQGDKNILFLGHAMLASIYTEQMKIEDAISEFKLAIELKPDSERSYFAMGMCYAQIKKYEEASEALQKVIQIGDNGESKGALAGYARKTLERIYYESGIEYGAQGKFEEAKGEFKKALEIDRFDTSAEECLKLTADVLEKRLENEAAIHSFKGIACDNIGSDEAIAEYKKAIAISPDYARAHNNLGIAYHDKGMLDETIVEYEKAIAINPDYAAAHTNLGIIYGEKGMLDEAITEHKKAIAINPDYATAYNNLGAAYGNKGMLDERIAEYKKAIAINPNYTEAHTNLGAAYGDKEMWDEAIAEYKKAIAINPDYAPAHNNLGIAYTNKGMWDEAIAECEKAIAINPDNAKAHCNLGIAYSAKGMWKKWDESIAEYKKAITIDPDYAKAHCYLGIAYSAKGMPDEAINEYQMAIAIDEYGLAHYNLADIYYRQGHYDLAIKHCDKAIEVGYEAQPGFLEMLKPYRK